MILLLYDDINKIAATGRGGVPSGAGESYTTDLRGSWQLGVAEHGEGAAGLRSDSAHYRCRLVWSNVFDEMFFFKFSLELVLKK